MTSKATDGQPESDPAPDSTADSSGASGGKATGRDWWISLNVTRTRITLLGFNLSVVAFMVGILLADTQEKAFGVHLPAMSALYVSFLTTMISVGCLLASQELDRVGLSKPWSFAIGDVLMYLAMSQSVSGFTRKYLSGIHEAIDAIHREHLPLVEFGGFLTTALASVGVLGWALLTYVGPLVSIAKSPVPKGGRKVLFALYVVLLLCVFYIATQAHILQDAVLGDYQEPWSIFLYQFVQPLAF